MHALRGLAVLNVQKSDFSVAIAWNALAMVVNWIIVASAVCRYCLDVDIGILRVNDKFNQIVFLLQNTLTKLWSVFYSLCCDWCKFENQLVMHVIFSIHCTDPLRGSTFSHGSPNRAVKSRVTRFVAIKVMCACQWNSFYVPDSLIVYSST